MKLRAFKESDYTLFCEWLGKWGWPALPLNALPKNALVVENVNHRPLVMGFLYSTDSCISWLEWVTRDPGIDFRVGEEAIGVLLQGSFELAKTLGFSLVFSATKNARLTQKYEDNGLKQSEAGMTHFMGVVS